MKSVAKLVIMIYWQRQQEQQGGYDLVHHLESHYLDWSMEMKQEWDRIQDFLWKHLAPLGWLLSHETGVDIMHLISKIESNGFGIYLENRKDILAGRALYPLASLFNHDCSFNCEVEQWTEEGIEEEQVKSSNNQLDSDNKEDDDEKVDYPSVFTRPRGKFRQMFIRTITHIQPDQPLTIGYVDTNLPVANRRQKLLQDYYFTCLCQRCVMESTIKVKNKKKNKHHGLDCR
ncbi:hypothetical protein BC941DRAFT_235713 [Chlamydoabsidia padenii]|nr:hypothetical protein BC941DRAFT_235713 [Chlamydoabsidia padenii]